MATNLTDQTTTIAACREAIARQPDDIAAHERLAQLCRDLDNSDESAGLYLKAGALHHAQGNPDLALACWRKAIEVRPRLVSAHLNIAKVLRDKGRGEAAIAVYHKIIAIDPNCALAYRFLGGLLQGEKKFDQAIQAYRKLLEINPGSEDALAGLAAIYEREGNIQEAHEMLRPLVGAETTHLRSVLAFATVCRRLKPASADALPLLKRQLARTDLPNSDRIKVLTALAKLCDELDRYEEAFHYLLDAKALQPTNSDGSQARLLETLVTWKRIYSAERIAHLPRATHGSNLPIFILGMPRSGTTLTEQILSRHPKVYGGGELLHIMRMGRTALGTGLPYPQCLDAFTPEIINTQAADYLQRVRALAPTAERITDKMPFNFMHLGLIQILFPQARIIHCTRQPLDNCVSAFFNEFPDGLSITHDLTTLGLYYRGYRELMQHWQQTLSLPVFTLNYEQLVAEPERNIRSLVEFCKLEWNDVCLKFYDSRRRVDTPNYHNVRQPIYARSVGRYRAYEPWLDPLKKALGDLL